MKCPVCERSELVESVENYHYRECGLENIKDAARKAANGLRLFVEMDQHSEWKLAV